MNSSDIVAGLELEFRRGTIIMLVLDQLTTESYGYDLVKRLEEGGVPIEANSLYPLMRRLESQGLLVSHWETSESKPRKYYQISKTGTKVLESTKILWKEFTGSVNAMMEVEK